MNKVRDLYQKADLSEEKRAQLKAQFKERFPQYAKDTSGTEEVAMNKSTINNFVPVKVRTRAIAGIAAALVIAAGGTAYIMKHNSIDSDRDSLSVSSHRGDDDPTGEIYAGKNSSAVSSSKKDDDPTGEISADRNSSTADDSIRVDNDGTSWISAKDSDAQTNAAENTSEAKETSATQQTAVEKDTETMGNISAAETWGEDGTVDTITDNNDISQSQAEEMRSESGSDKPVMTTVTQAAVTQTETTTVTDAGDSGQPADIFKMLDSLDYHAISCDGLPEYTLAAPDGTLYLINFSEGGTQPGWVWRRPSLIADADNEAPLTQEIIDAIYANWDKLNIYICEWN